MPNLAGKVAIITGSSSGIGASTAVYFAQLGCNVSITGRSEAKLEKTKAECLKAGLKENQIHSTVCDVTTDKQLKNLVDGTLKKFGKLDILVNNAGISGVNISINDPIENYDRVMNTNVRSVIVLTKLCIEHLVKTKGSIVNVSSIASLQANPMYAYYCISKIAIDQLTKCLALELAGKGVRVNCVNPAAIRTPIFETIGVTAEHLDEFEKVAAQFHPLGRIGEPDEVAKAIAFLASDDASFTTGQLLAIDGGVVSGVPANPQFQQMMGQN